MNHEQMVDRLLQATQMDLYRLWTLTGTTDHGKSMWPALLPSKDWAVSSNTQAVMAVFQDEL